MKKFFAIVLCMALIVTMLPFNAFAEEAESQDMNTDISAQEVEQADDVESNISEAEQESDNEAEKSRALMPASAAAGSIAEVSWDDDGNAEYNVVTESSIYVSAGSESNYFSIGKMESGKFCPAEGAVDSCSITVNRDDWSEPVSKDEPTWSNPLRAGGFEGYYDFDEEALYLGYNENAIFLGEDAYGAYQVTVNWTAGGTEYYAEIVLNLKPAEMLTRGSFSGNPGSWEKEAGFSKSFYINEHLEMKDYIYRLKYAPCIDYENTGKSSTMILSDGEHGILNFKDSDCDIEGLFAAGKSVKYKSDVTVIPMTVDYSKVTADIMGKVYALTFADSSGNEVTCRICFEKDETVDRLEDGRLYTIEAYEDPIVKNGNIYVSSVEWQLSDCVELTVKTAKTLFFGIWRAETQQLELAEISIDELGENMSLEECEGGSYMISSDVSGSGNLKTANGETIKYTSTLPSCGVYSASEKSDENYLTDQISLNETGKEFYLIVDGNGTEKNELQLNISVQEAFSASYYGEDTKGDNKYFIWKITASDEFEPEDDGISVDFEILKNNKYYDSTWLYISYTIAAEQQLYWFYDYEASVDSNGMIETEAVGEQNKRIWTEVNRTMTGYFAVETESGSYKAVDSVISESPDDLIVTKTEDGYAYNLKWAKEGNYICRATVDGKEYKIKAGFNLPSMGFYSTEDRSIDSYLGNEFHYIDAADENKKEAYFYIITDTCGYELDEVTMTCGRWVRGEWKAKKVNGISIESIPGSDKYFVYRVTVSDQYRENGDSERFGLANYNGSCSCSNWIQIYDSTEISQNQQLYWFDSWKVKTDSKGKLSLPEETGYNSLDDAASKRLEYYHILNESYEDKQGYFAIKDSEGGYYAVDTVSAPDTKAVEISKNGFEYSIRWKEFGEYQFTAEKDGENYRFYLIARLPGMGFYKHPVRISENYIEEFYFADAAETGNNGKEAYFYIIASTYGYEADNIEIKTRIYNDETYEYEDADVQGVSVEKLEDFPLDSEDCCVWKVTVTDEYKGDYTSNSRVNFKVVYNENDWNSEGINIYDSEAISPDQQMYWFYNGNVRADENGKLTAEAHTTLNEAAQKEMYREGVNSTYGYLAVKDDNGDYYALDNVTVSDRDNVKLSKDGFEYYVSWNQFGSYVFKGIRDGKAYKFKLTVNLPSMGFYSSPDRSVDKYLGTEMYFEDIPQKSKDKKEAIAYFITPIYSDKDNIKIEVGQYKLNSDSGEREWQAENNDGIVFSNQKEAVFGTEKYYVWEVHIGNKYELNKDYEIALINTEIQGPFDLLRDIVIHNADEVAPSQQIYYFNSQDVDIVNGKIVFKEEASENNRWTLGNLTCGRTWWVDCFAIKKDGEYYKVDIADAKGVRYSVDETSGYITIIAEKTGEYTITAVYDGKRYYSKGTIVLPDEGFWSEPNRSDETLLKEFNYNTADENKHFYYILPKTYLNNFELSDISLTPSILSADSTGPHFSPAPGISAIRLKEFTEQYPEYYCWEIKVGSEFRGADNIYMCFKAGDNEKIRDSFWVIGYKTYAGNILEGKVTSSDNTDNAKMMLYRVDKLKGLVTGEYTDSKAEAYIKSDIIGNSHYGSSATEKGRITGTGGIYSQTYKFADVDEGEYKLAVYKPGYGVHIEDVTVTDSTVIGDIKLSLLGDANGDGKIRIGDKAVLARAIAGWTGYENLLNKEAADINGDGLIKNDDLMILSRHLAGWLGYSQLEYGKQKIKAE